MSRRRSKPKKTAANDGKSKSLESSGPRGAATPQPNAIGKIPSRGVRAGISVWVSIHLFALIVSYTGVVEPSTLHAQFSSLVHPYLRPTHFAADDRPVYLSYGESDDQPHRVQITTQPVAEMQESREIDWVTVGPGENRGLAAVSGLAVSDRVARWLATASMLAENDQPSMVADLMLPVVQADSSIQGIRIVRYPTDLSDVTAQLETPYVARVLRSADAVSLIQLKERRLSSVPVPDSIQPSTKLPVSQSTDTTGQRPLSESGASP